MLTFLSKLLLNGMIVVPFLAIFSEATLTAAIVTATILCVLAYIVGDQLILRQAGNTVATVADIGLTYVFLWMVANFMNWSLSLLELICVSVAVGVVEYVLHALMIANLNRQAVGGHR